MNSKTPIYCGTVIPRFNALLSGKLKFMVNRGTVNRGKVNTCSIVKHDNEEHKEAHYIERHGKLGPGKSRDNCI